MLRAAAPWLAISLRRSGESFFARLFASATAAGFFRFAIHHNCILRKRASANISLYLLAQASYYEVHESPHGKHYMPQLATRSVLTCRGNMTKTSDTSPVAD